jgi:hypothetical protein
LNVDEQQDGTGEISQVAAMMALSESPNTKKMHEVKFIKRPGLAAP